MLKIKACIFDLDGTLLDTIKDIGNAVNSAISEFGYKPHPLNKYNDFVGSGSKTLIKKAIGIPVDELEFKKIYDLYIEIYRKNLCVYTLPYDGIYKLLDYLQAKGILLAVNTNKPHEFAVNLVSQFFGRYNFKPVYGQIDEIPVKPDPTQAIQIASELQLKPDEIAFIGDSFQDTKTALNSGMIPFSVLWGFQTKEQLISGGSTNLFSSPYEIQLKIDEIYNF